MTTTLMPSWILRSTASHRGCPETLERRATRVEQQLARQRREREIDKTMRMIVPMR